MNLFMFNKLPQDIQSYIASYWDTPELCFFAQTSKRSLLAVLPLLKQHQQTLLNPPQLCITGRRNVSIAYTSEALHVCGENSSGQLGLGNNNNRTTFTQVQMPPGMIRQVIAGVSHTLVLTSQGLYACGDNRLGQLGLGDKDNRTTFTQVQTPPGTIQQVIAGSSYTLVLTSQGLYACGNNHYGQLGLGDKDNRTTFTQVQTPPGTIQQVIAYYLHTLVLTSQGLYACGNNDYGQLGLGNDRKDRTTFTQVQGLPGTIQQVLVSYYYTLALTSQGLYACGTNGYGQLGLGNDRKDRTTFTQVQGLSGTIQRVIAGYLHALVLTSQGLYACGNNRDGQLGLGDKDNRTTFTQVQDLSGTIQQVIAGDSHTLVLTSQGLYACGDNSCGQLGLGDKNNCTTLTKIGSLPAEIKKRLALYHQIRALNELSEPTAHSTQQSETHPSKRQKFL